MENRYYKVRDALGSGFMDSMKDSEWAIVIDLIARVEARMEGKETYALDRLQMESKSTETGLSLGRAAAT